MRQVLAANGFNIGRPALLDARALRVCPTTWAKRLVFGRDPRALYMRAIFQRRFAHYELTSPAIIGV